MAEQQVIHVKELDTEIIPPFTSRFEDPKYNGGCKLVVVGKPGCFTKGTEMIKYDGSLVKVENVKVGDIMLGDDGTKRTVIELCRNSDEMFDIIPKFGEKYTVNLMHKLVLTNFANTNEIIEITVKDYLAKDKEWKNQWGLFRVSVDFDEQSVDVEPYTFGKYLMGNEISSDTYEILNDTSKIDIKYKRNSRTNRLLLLSGMLDTCGVYNSRGNYYEISHTSNDIANDIIFISRSLGFSIIKHECTKIVDNTCVNYYRVTISGHIDEIPCKILGKPRKCLYNNLVTRFIVKSKGVDNYYGFTLDGNHRFLLSTFDVVRNTGKSTLIKALLYSKRHILSVGLAMNGTEETNHAYRDFMPSTFVYNEYNEEKIVDFIQRQKLARKHLQNPWAALIVDDCTDDPKIFNKKTQLTMYKNSRHFNSFYILSLQYAMDVKPAIRTNVDGIFILREPILKNRKALYENYASIIPDFATFCLLMDELTNDYCAMYIHGSGQTNDWQDCVYYWKAPEVPKDWKLGCPEYWEFHNARFASEHGDLYAV